ncbi:MAG: aldehyde dehydrogenase family protein, partial [Pseudomonadota bacterium]
MENHQKFYINGAWVSPLAGRKFSVENPATEEEFATISIGGQADTDAAVAAAKAAFPEWAATPKEERIAALERLLKCYLERTDEMAQTISTEMGAPISMARHSQATAGSWHIENMIKAAKNFAFEKSLGEHAPDDRILFEPIGVCALITPWNWPMNQIALKVGPALVAGCTMVLKPSEISPLSAMLFAELIDEIDLPPGVFNLVNGDGAGVGTQLSVHADVDMVSFTGSTRAGRAITKAAADTIKRVSLELGGKGANIIFADADDEAIERGTRHCFNNSGQSCNAPTRMLVERPLYEKAVTTAQKIAQDTQISMNDAEGAHIGPVVSKVQFDKIQNLIDTGIKE